MRWSRRGKRYERIGTLVDPAALWRARGELGGEGETGLGDTTDDDPIPF